MPVVLPNATEAGETLLPVPIRADSRPYRFEMLFNGFADRAYADTADELLACLIPDYLRMRVPQQHAHRLKFAVRAQVIVQTEINYEYDLATCSPDEQAILLGHRNTPPEVESWSAAVPLVLVDVYYDPSGMLRRPFSGLFDVVEPPNVFWLSPTDPYEFLVSLHRIGFIALNEHRDHHV